MTPPKDVHFTPMLRKLLLLPRRVLHAGETVGVALHWRTVEPANTLLLGRRHAHLLRHFHADGWYGCVCRRQLAGVPWAERRWPFAIENGTDYVVRDPEREVEGGGPRQRLVVARRRRRASLGDHGTRERQRVFRSLPRPQDGQNDSRFTLVQRQEPAEYPPVQ